MNQRENSFGRTLREHRQTAGLTQAELGWTVLAELGQLERDPLRNRRAGQRLISRLERGVRVRDCDPARLGGALRRALGLTPAVLRDPPRFDQRGRTLRGPVVPREPGRCPHCGAACGEGVAA